MADETRIDHPVAAPGVKATVHRNFRRLGWYEYDGTGPALVAAGIVRSDWLPGEAGCPRKDTFRTTSNDREISVHRRGKKFKVRVRLTPEENQDRQEREARDLNVRAARAQADIELNAMPPSAAAFQHRAANMFESILAAEREFLETFGYGYRFDSATMATFDWACAELVRALEEGVVRFNAKERARIVAGLKQKVSGADASFQGFIATAVAAAAHG